MELQRLKGRLKTAQRGHKLLKDKRDELMKRFLDVVGENRALRKRVEEGLMGVHRAFTVAAALMSPEVLEQSLLYPTRRVEVEVTVQNVMSVEVPRYQVKTSGQEPEEIFPYGFAQTRGELDDAIEALFHVLPDVGPVYSISIIPTGPAGGYTMPLPEKDEMYDTKGKMLQEITVSLGGRVAEEEIFDDITTGASQDIKQATAIAKSMITKFGMSERLGLINYDNDSDEVFIGRDFGHTSRGYGEKVAGTIDEEVKRIVDECYQKARAIIHENHAVLDACAKLLLEKEKITRSEFEALFETSGADAQ